MDLNGVTSFFITIIVLIFSFGAPCLLEAAPILDSALKYSETLEKEGQALQRISPRSLKRDAEQFTEQATKLVASLQTYQSNRSPQQLKRLMDLLADQWSGFGDWRDSFQDEQADQLEDTLNDLDDPSNFDDRGINLQSLLSGSVSTLQLEEKLQVISRSLERVNRMILQDLFDRIGRIRPEKRRQIARDTLQTFHQHYFEDLNKGWSLRNISGSTYLSIADTYFEKVTNDPADAFFSPRELGLILRSQGEQLLSVSPAQDEDRNRLKRLNTIVGTLLPGQQRDGEFGALR